MKRPLDLDLRAYLPPKWLAIACLVLLGVPLFTYWLFQPLLVAIFPFYSPKISSTGLDIVQYEVGRNRQAHFRIPRAYVVKDAEPEFLVLEAVWGNMEPWSRRGIPKRDPVTNTLLVPEVSEADRLSISLSRASLSSYERVRTGFYGRDPTFEPAFDLMYLANEVSGPDLIRTGDYYFPADPDEWVGLYFFCLVKCRGFIYAGDPGISADFSFPKQRLGEWRALSSRMTEFLDDIRVDQVSASP